MKPVELIREVKRRSAGSWETLLPQCGVTVPAKGHHGPCAICGGTDRFHFIDDHGAGEWHCRQCDAPNHGDALDLIARANGQTVTEAAQLVAGVLGIDEREPITTTSQGKTSTAADHQQERREKAAIFASGWQEKTEEATPGPSPYLTRKGFPDAVCPVLPDGKTLVALVNESGAIVAGQTIPVHGKKYQITGSAKKGAYHVVNTPGQVSVVILAEGLATAHSVTQMRPDALTVYAVDAGNLLPVAEVMRRKYPDAQLIIAADNDWHEPGELDDKGKLKTNTGRIAAEKAAIAVNGWIAVPPTDHKADWNDWHQQNGLESATAAFKTLMYQPEGKNVTDENKLYEQYISGERTNVEQIHPQRKTRLPMSIGSAGYDAQLDYVLKGIIPSNSLGSVYGASGSYKSFLACSWACHIATGKAWGGRRVAEGSVMYVVGEGGIGVPRRVKAWEIVNRMEVENLYLVNTPVFPASPMDVNEMAVAAKQVEEETGKPVRLIILDTLARCFGASDENDAKDMGAFVRGCDELKNRTGAAILVVHHSGKDATRGARGSSAFRASLDAEFQVSREAEGNALIIACTKMKDAEEPKEVAYDLRVVELFTDTDGELITSLVVIDKPREPKVDEYIGEAGNKTENHIALWQCVRSRTAKSDPCTIALIRDDMKAMGINIKHFSRWLGKLKKDGLIRIDGEKLYPLSKDSEE